jgi:hypothetical protein
MFRLRVQIPLEQKCSIAQPGRAKHPPKGITGAVNSLPLSLALAQIWDTSCKNNPDRFFRAINFVGGDRSGLLLATKCRESG